jgi:hypothetical protein
VSSQVLLVRLHLQVQAKKLNQPSCLAAGREIQLKRKVCQRVETQVLVQAATQIGAVALAAHVASVAIEVMTVAMTCQKWQPKSAS